MDKLRSVVSIISSILFIMAGILLFSCQEKTKVEEKTIVNGDTTTVITKEVKNDSLAIDKTRWREESEDIKERLNKLGVKAKQKGGDLGKKINERIDKMETERQSYHKDTTSSDFKEHWKAFKDKTSAAIDSLDRKMDEKRDKKK
ncbi:MAG: hypothetical protein ACJ75J_05420 [Cytophagaceae bacterium]